MAFCQEAFVCSLFRRPSMAFPVDRAAEHERQAFARLRAEPTENETTGKRAVNLENALIRANRLHAMFGDSRYNVF